LRRRVLQVDRFRSNDLGGTPNYGVSGRTPLNGSDNQRRTP
jgi:hypothetical protein